MPIGVPKVPFRLPGEPSAQWVDLYNRLYRERVLFLCQELDDELANQLIGIMLYLNAEENNKSVYIYINSPGGSYTAMTAIYDTMQFIKPQIQTICLGQAASAASVILAAGSPGKRFALPHARILIHQPYTEGGGQGSDIEIQANEILRMRAEMEGIFAKHTGKKIEEIQKDIERDKILTAEDAQKYGIIDQVIASRKSAQK